MDEKLRLAVIAGRKKARTVNFAATTHTECTKLRNYAGNPRPQTSQGHCYG